MYNQKTNSYGGQVRTYTSKVSGVSDVSEVSKMSKQGEQQSLHSLLPMGEGGRRPDEGADIVRSYTQETGRLASTNTQKITERNVSLNNALASGSAMVSENISFCSQSAIQHDVTRHKAAEPASCKSLVPQCPSALVTSQKAAFTLAEGRPACTTTQVAAKAAFTLAEVLITLAVIGIVAALTLPGLIQNHNEKAWSTAKDLWEKKLTETVRRMNTDGVMTGHDTTEDFMDTFKQYMKVIKTCDNTDINKCYSPKVVTTGKNDDPMEIETDSLTSASSMGLSDWQTNTNTMSFVVADGTTVIMAYQPECPYADPIEDTGSQVSCMGYMVDVNGKKGPNRVGKDIQLSSGVAFSTCDNPIGDMCWSTEFAANTPLDTTLDENKQYDENYATPNNYWAGAKKACKDKGMSLPTRAQLAQLASNLYVDSNGNEVTIAYNESKSNLKVKDEYKDNPPITLGYAYWSSEEYSAISAYYRSFYATGANGSDGYWVPKYVSSNSRAVCISN